MTGRGFTLLEVIVSSMLLSIVVSAASALLFVTARAAPVTDDPGVAAAETLRALDLLSSELAFATRVTAAEAHRVEFVIRDRDSDGADDTISYRWSGAVGDPWTRAVGTRDPDPIVRSLASLSLTYLMSEDGLRIAAVHFAVHPQASRASLMPTTVRLVNLPDAP
jgi:prepilin-type N-terminal cleavage/methylation domain-containing protein